MIPSFYGRHPTSERMVIAVGADGVTDTFEVAGLRFSGEQW